MKPRLGVAPVLLLAATCCSAPRVSEGLEPLSQEGQIVHRAGSLPWGPGPESAPFPSEMAVLEGSPKSQGLFTLRLRTTEPWLMPPHSHPRSERVTVLRGRIGVGFGRSVDRSRGQSFGPGDYYVNPPGAIHFVWADEPVEIQITGIGPWEVHPIE